jgi:hypothetical protein
MKTALSLIACVAIVLCTVGQTQAALTYYEGFDYGNNATIDGVGGWANLGDTVGTTATGLTYANLVTTGGAAKRAAIGNGTPSSGSATKTPAGVADLFNSTDSVFYASLLIGDTNDPSNNSPHTNLWIMQDDGFGGANDDGITIDTTGGAAIRINIHQFGGGESGASYAATAGTKLFAIRFTMNVGADSADFILNPDVTTLVDSDFDAATVVTSTGELTDPTGELDRMLIYFATGGATSILDEIRFGTTIAEVFPVIPEPASLALLGLGGLMMLNRRRRA